MHNKYEARGCDTKKLSGRFDPNGELELCWSKFVGVAHVSEKLQRSALHFICFVVAFPKEKRSLFTDIQYLHTETRFCIGSIHFGVLHCLIVQVFSKGDELN